MNNRRKTPRLAISFNVDIFDSSPSSLDGPLEATTTNISKEGLGITVPKEMSLVSPVSVSIQEGNFNSLCLCDVIWAKKQGGATAFGLTIRKWTQLDRLLRTKLSSLGV